jgi:hypothetical protein
VVGAEERGCAGKAGGDGGGTLLKGCGGEATEGGGLGSEGAMRRREGVGPGPDRGPAVACTSGRHCPNRGASASDAWAPTGSGRERERRGTGARGPARERKEKWAEPG